MTHYYTILKTNNTVSYGRNYTFDCYYTSLSLTHYFYVCVIECTAVDNFHLGGFLPYLASPSNSNTVPRRAINIIIYIGQLPFPIIHIMEKIDGI